MSFKAFVAKILASYIDKKVKKWMFQPIETQQKTFVYLMKNLSKTEFGKDHRINENTTYEEFKKLVPIRDYEALKPYFEKIKNGEENITWLGKPLYLSKTSGTTSGVKYIPITKDSIGNHINSAKNALLNYIHETGKAEFLDGKLIFLSGSPTLTDTNGVPTGRLSGISNHHVPGYLRKNQMPSYTTNCIEDWEQKVDAIVEETFQKNMTLISGIPPWVQMYFDKLIAKIGKPIKDIFPNFNLFVYGGVNFEPYRSKMEESIGRKVDAIELYPASEGFFAYQNEQNKKGLLLLLNEGIYYEFIPTEEYFNENPTRLSLSEVELNKNYALIINSNAGIWGYSIGDTIKFVSENPYKIVVSGRIKHYISAFGEHVIGEEVDAAMLATATKHHAEIIEFTVAPFVAQNQGKSYHEWLISFGKRPQNMESFSADLDTALQTKNIYYSDLIKGNILSPLKITELKADAFIQYMKNEGKLGGQNKVPRLSNDRIIAEKLEKYKL